MAVSIPQVITEDRASGAQVIDGSLRFDNDKTQYLNRTFSAGNQKTFTFSTWIKRASNFGTYNAILTTLSNDGNGNTGAWIGDSQDEWYYYIGSQDFFSNAKVRDTGWYHVVYRLDTTQSTDSDRLRVYVNGNLMSWRTGTQPSLDYVDKLNSAASHSIGRRDSSNTHHFDGSMSQFYFIDGQSLGPENFGYTDPLTNTWRPKKYTGEFNAAANPGTSFDDATDGKPFVNTTDEGQTLGSGYVSGATTNAILVVPGYNLTEEGTSNSISNSGATTVSNAKWYGTAIQFGTAANEGNVAKCLSYGTALGLSGANNFTMEAWVYPRPGSGSYNIIFEGDWQSNHGIMFQLDTDRKPKLYFGNGGFQTFTSDLIVTADEWSHVAVVCDNNTIRFFVNGTMDTKGTRTMNYTVGNGYRLIGAYWDTNYVSSPRSPFYGYMQDIRVTSDAKYTSDFTVPGSGAVPAGVNGFYLPFDGSAPIGQDQSGNGNDWTPVNFGGSVALDNPIVSGAFPILNTDGGGKTARPGVFGSEVGAYYAVTVPGGIGGGYYLDGTQKPTLSLIRGATYTFDQSDSSNSGHPLVFGTTADGNDYSDGVTTNGTPGSAGAYTKITVPHNAPDTLYYHCSAHGGMGSSTTQTTDTKKADPYAWKNVLGLPLVGSANDVSNRINSGSTTKTVTVTGPVSSSAQSNFYGGSYYFDGSNDELTIADSADWDIGSGDFTMEFWMYQISITNTDTQILNQWGASGLSGVWYIKADSLTSMTANFRESADLNNGSAATVSVSGTISDNKWQHIAVSRDGTNLRMFVDGVLQNTSTMNFTVANAVEPLRVGRQGYTPFRNGQPYNGYLSDIRIYKGVAKYTSDFIVPATSPDVLPDTPSGVSGSSKLTKITDGAVYFDGSGDYLELADSADFDFGSGEFTVEAFIQGANGGSRIASNVFNQSVGGASSDSAFYFGAGNTGTSMYLSTSGTAWTNYIECAGLVHNSGWHHIAWQRRGDVMEIYVDGIKQTVDSGNAAITGSVYNSSRVVEVGRQSTSGSNFLGHISNLRVIKGTALYTSNFTPPTRALTNVTNTKLLCCQGNKLEVLTDTTNATGGNSIQNTNNSGITSTTGNRTDSLSSNLVLAIPFNESTDDISDEINVSSVAKSATLTNSPVSESIGHFYGQSYKFAGSGGQRINYSASADFDFGTGDFCIEGWYYHLEKTVSNTVRRYFIHTETAWGGNRWIIYTSYTGYVNKATFYTYPTYSTNGSAPHLIGTTIFEVGNWYHIAITRSGNTFRLFVNGILEDQADSSTSVGDSSNSIQIGGGSNQTDRTLYGNVQDVRIYKGTPKYTAPFVPPRIPTLNSSVTPNSDFIGRVGSVAPTNFNPFNTDINTVRGQETGYATLNPLSTLSHTLKNGNLTVDANVANDYVAATINLPSSGKFYIESTSFNPNGANRRDSLGVYDTSVSRSYGSNLANSANYNANDGKVYQSGSAIQTYTTWDNGDTVSCAFDCDTGKVWFAKNGIFNGVPGVSGEATTLTNNGSLSFGNSCGSVDTSYYIKVHTNFGQNPFKFPPPEGFQPLNAANVRPSTVIARPDKFVNATLWSGDNVDGRVIDCGHQPDLIWVKTRNQTNWHWLSDSLRGTADKRYKLYSNDTTAQDTAPIYGQADSFVSNGWIAGGGTDGSNPLSDSNQTGTNYVCWSWKAGGNKNTFNVDDVGYASAAAAGLDGGTITPTGASVNTKSGFSIIKYNSGGSAGNYTISHGLTQTPKFIIHKSLGISNWWVYHASVIDNLAKYMQLNSTNPIATNSANMWGGQFPDSSVLGVRVGDLIGTSTDAIMYTWAEIPGFSKFGSYVSNGSTDGNFVELGFKPAVVIIKSATYSATTTSWAIYTSDLYPNQYQNALFANKSSAEGVRGDGTSTGSLNQQAVDLLSNGFKLRNNGSETNEGSSNVYIYAAWAEAPTFNLYGAQSNAR